MCYRWCYRGDFCLKAASSQIPQRVQTHLIICVTSFDSAHSQHQHFSFAWRVKYVNIFVVASAQRAHTLKRMHIDSPKSCVSRGKRDASSRRTREPETARLRFAVRVRLVECRWDIWFVNLNWQMCVGGYFREESIGLTNGWWADGIWWQHCGGEWGAVSAVL